MGAPLPKMLHLTAEFVLNTALRKEFMAEELDLERVQTLLDTAAREKIQWDEAWLGYALTKRFGRMADDLAVKPREDSLYTASTWRLTWCAHCPSRSISAACRTCITSSCSTSIPSS